MSRNSPRKIVPGVNDLASTHPDLCREVDGWDPVKFSAGMSRKMAWRCRGGHSWEARIQQRAIGAGCPFCVKNGRRVLVGETDLATTHPKIAATAFEWDPSKYLPGSGKKQKWVCQLGHIYSARIVDRTAGLDCVICSNNQILTGFNDLASKNPEIAKEAHGWDPKVVLYSSTKRMPWECSRGHRWEVSIASRFRYKTGCPFCSGLRTIVGETDLLTVNPGLASEAFGWDPGLYKPGSNLKMKWKCPVGHVYQESLNQRTRTDNPRGCQFCSGKRVLKGFNDIETTHADKAKMAFGWDPSEVSFGMVKKLKWKCPKGHEWIQSPNNVCSSKFGCPVCANLEIRFHVNDLQTLQPDLAAQAHGWDATKYGASSQRIMSWKCSLGHIWNASITNRYIHNSNCPVCAGQKVWPGFNDLQTKYPEIARQAEGWNPAAILAGGITKRLWRCENGHTWKTDIRSRIQGTGCPSCAKYGFDPNLSAFLYLFEHEEIDMYQIGITNAPEQRLSLHKQRGWTLLDLMGPIDGLLARNWESSILEHVSKNGGVMGKQSGVKKFDGYTEAWMRSSFKIYNLRSIMEKIREIE
jgi:hypothetical protein